MKNYILVFFAFLLLAGCKESKKDQAAPVTPSAPGFIEQLVPENVSIEVTLIKEIPEGTQLRRQDLADYLQLTVKNSNGEYGSIIGDSNSFRQFTVDVFADRTVTWKRKSLAGNGNQRPKIDSIFMKERNGGKRIIPEQGERVNGGNQPEKDGNDLRFKVNRGNLNKGDIENYTIRITIMGQDNPIDIDPVIRYHPE